MNERAIEKNMPNYSILLILVFIVSASAHSEAEGGAADCAYAKVAGAEFSFVEFDSKYSSSVYETWFTEPNVYPGQQIPYVEYVGKRGKLLMEPQNAGYSEDYVFRKAILEDCREVYGQDPRPRKRVQGVVFLNEVPELKKKLSDFSKKYSGKSLWYRGGLSRDTETMKLGGLPSGASRTTLLELKVLPISTKLRFGPAGIEEPAVTLKVANTGETIDVLPSELGGFFHKNPIPPGTKKQVIDAINQGQVILGMTGDQVLLSIGEPEAVNTTVGVHGKLEQWVYGNSNIYIENGKVSGFQYSR